MHHHNFLTFRGLLIVWQSVKDIKERTKFLAIKKMVIIKPREIPPMVEVYHVQGKELKKLSGSSFKFLNGDVYVVRDGLDVYVWLGSKAFADDRAVGAWAAKVMDIKDKDVNIHSEVEGHESEKFKSLVNFTVVEGDTPGFLRHIPEKTIEFKMFHIRDIDLTDGSSSDDIVTSEVPMSPSSLKSDDVFVIDGYDVIYVWIGKNSQVGEKAAGNRLARSLDVERKRTPLVYVVHEGEEPPGFFEFIEKLAQQKKQTVTSGTPTREEKKSGGLFSKIKRIFGK